MLVQRRSKILGIGSHFPENVVKNSDLEKLVDTTDQWIRERTGIEERRILLPGQKNSDLGAEAARRALANAGKSASDIDLIISCSNSQDRYLPAMACVIQDKIGAHNGCGAFDLTAACAGWVVGLSVANQFIQTGAYRTVLLVGSEALTRFTNWKDRNTCVLFGDGAGAAVIGLAPEGDESGILSVDFHSDGRLGDLLHLPGGGSETPMSEEVLKNNLQFFQMNGAEVFKHAVRNMASVAEETLARNKVELQQIDWLIPHQANFRIIEAVAHRLKFPMSKVAVNLQKYGNTSAASIPTVLDEFSRNGKIKRGDLLLLTSFGGGFTWAGALMRW